MSYSFQRFAIPEFLRDCNTTGNGDRFAAGTGFEEAEKRANPSYPAPDPLNRPFRNGDCFLEYLFERNGFWMGFYSFLEKPCSILRIPDGPF